MPHPIPRRNTGYGPSVPLSSPPLLLLLLLATSAQAAPPTTNPTPSQPLVMIFPFESVGEQSIPWLPVAIQQNLVAELARTGRLRPAPIQVPEGKHVEADAPQWARTQGSNYVILGTYQLIDTDLRVTAQIIESSTGNVLTGLKASGPVRDLFTLEDTLANQAKRALLPPTPAVAQATTAPAPPALPEPAPLPSPVAIQSSGPVQTSSPRLQTQFEGSALQKSLNDPRSYSQTYGNTFDAERHQYRYYSNPAYPYYYGNGFYGYGPYYYTPYLGPTNYVYTYPGGLGAW